MYTISTSFSEEWPQNTGDFFQSYEFHKIAELNSEGQPIIYICLSENCDLLGAWPVLKRKIDGSTFDYSSVYGYAGPYFSPGVDREKVVQSILAAMADSGAVSLFSRLHPFVNNGIDWEGLGGQHLGDIVWINPNNSVDEFLLDYKGGHRRDIINAMKKGVNVWLDKDLNSLDKFVEIYHSAMQKVNASSYYFFNIEYFEKISKMKNSKVYLIFASIGEEVIACSMFVVTGKIMQYYLSGTYEKYRCLSPSKNILYEAHQLANKLGCEYFILGGGVGAKDDALFKFKAGFSNLREKFYIFKKIFNQKEYQKLCSEKNINSSKISFFPAYRSN